MGSYVVSFLILAVIILYAAYVIRKKIKDVKAGKFCGGGCSGCSSVGKCKKNEK